MLRTSVVLAALLVSVPATAAPPSWQWEHPGQYGGAITALHAIGDTVYAAGPRGALLTSSDGGGAWSALATDVTTDLQAIGSSPDLVVVVGDTGTVLRSRDGTTFQRITVPTPQDLVDVAVDATTVLVLARNGAVLRSTDGGDTFAAFGSVGSTGATAIAIAPKETILVATVDGVWASTDGGTTFTPTAVREPVQRLRVDDQGMVYAVAGTWVSYHPVEMCGSCIGEHYETLALYRSADAGKTWKRRALVDPATTDRRWGKAVAPAPPREPPGPRIGHSAVHPPFAAPPFTPRALAFGAGGEVYASADQLHVSTDRGATFTTHARQPGALAATTTALVAAGAAGAFARSSDHGATWSASTQRRATDVNLFAMAALSGGRVFAVGLDGTLLARDPAHATWARVKVPTGKHQRLEAVYADGEDVVVVGERGVILHSRDGGRTFRHRASDRVDDLNAVWGSGDEVFAVGRKTLLHSRDRGRTWKSVTTELWDTYRLWGTAADDLYAIGAGVHHSTDRGRTWRALADSPGWASDVWGVAGELFVVGSEGRIAHSADRGKTWTTRASGTTKHLARIWGKGDELYTVGGGDYDGAIVLRSTDRGKTWTEETVPAQAAMIAVVGSGDAVYILGAGAVILRRGTP